MTEIGIPFSGNFLQKRYSEEVDVRINGDVDQAFEISIPYTPKPKNKKDQEKGKSANGKPTTVKPENRPQLLINKKRFLISDFPNLKSKTVILFLA